MRQNPSAENEYESSCGQKSW